MGVDAHQSIWMLDMCRIWSENREDGIGNWEEPNMAVDDYVDFVVELVSYFDCELEIGQDWEYAEALLQPFFPQMKTAEDDE